MTDSESTKWDDMVTAVKAARRQQLDRSAAPDSATGREAVPDAGTIAQIVAVAQGVRREWIIAVWRSLSLKVAAVALVLVGTAAVFFWMRASRVPDPTIIPLPALDQFPDATVPVPEP